MDTPTAQGLTRILGEYDLGELRDCRRVRHGYVNTQWLIETSAGRYIIKRRHPSLCRAELICAQHALIAHLRSTGFPAPILIPTRQEATFLQLRKEIYEVQVYIPGELCDIAQPAHHVAAARTLARYHDTVQGFDCPIYHWPRERYGPSALVRNMHWLEEGWPDRTPTSVDPLIGLLKEHIQDLIAHFGRFGPLPELVIHGDYYAHNLIMRGDEVVGVVDYDLAHWCPRAMEVAEALIYFASERSGRLGHIVFPGPLDLTKARRFLGAYLQVWGLTSAEIEALPHLIRTIWVCASLDPPLRPPMSPKTAPVALPEILVLARWALAHASELIEACGGLEKR